MLSFDDFPGRKKPPTSPATVDLSPGFGTVSNVQFHGGVGETTTLDLFPVSTKSIEAASSSFSSSPVLNHPEPQVAEPLSIIYKGEMHLLHVPAVKAKQIVEFANLRVSGSRAMKADVMEPMSTIYQGEVNVYIDVPAAKGKEILDFARVSAQGHYKCLSSKPQHPSYLLPMERRHRMQRFVERRKERITEMAPYHKGDMVDQQGIAKRPK